MSLLRIGIAAVDKEFEKREKMHEVPYYRKNPEGIVIVIVYYEYYITQIERW